jgi:hypothetical protein
MHHSASQVLRQDITGVQHYSSGPSVGGLSMGRQSEASRLRLRRRRCPQTPTMPPPGQRPGTLRPNITYRFLLHCAQPRDSTQEPCTSKCMPPTGSDYPSTPSGLRRVGFSSLSLRERVRVRGNQRGAAPRLPSPRPLPEGEGERRQSGRGSAKKPALVSSPRERAE